MPGQTKTTAVQLHCGDRCLRDSLTRVFARDHLPLDARGWLECVVDAPIGFALKLLPSLRGEHAVVWTENPCGEYWEDLWAYGPRVLVVGGFGVTQLELALKRAASGEHYRESPSYQSPLTRAERSLLRLGALGWENKHIAQRLRLRERTVQNGLTRVYAKLGLANRTEAALYYWGLWHLLHPTP